MRLILFVLLCVALIGCNSAETEPPPPTATPTATPQIGVDFAATRAANRRRYPGDADTTANTHPIADSHPDRLYHRRRRYAMGCRLAQLYDHRRDRRQ